jgi:hypothetical protein
MPTTRAVRFFARPAHPPYPGTMVARSLPLLPALAMLACGPLDGARPHLVVDPQALLMPGVDEGQSSHAPLTLLNLGHGPLTLRGLEVSDPGFTLEGCPAPSRLEPDEACTIEVRYASPGTGPRTARLLIRSDDLERPELEVPLAGPGSAAALSISPTALDFGPTPSGTSAVQTIHLVNLGLAPARALAASWPDGAGNFSAELVDDILAPGASTDATVRYTPTGGDADQATLELRWSEGARQITVRGVQDLKPPE